jgi:acetyltransferase-like isoleucine patch superfamily enzyme
MIIFNQFIYKLKCSIKKLRDNVVINNYGKNNKIEFEKCVNSKSEINIYGDSNKIKIKKSVIKNISININGSNNIISINNNCNITNSKIQILGDNHTLEINTSCRFKDTSFWFEDLENIISIGKGTTCEGAHIAVTETKGNIRIGEDCMLSFGIDIRNGDSHVILDKKTRNRINYPGDIKIGNHVWIGAHVQILKNTNIGSGSIIGIRSLVSKNVPDNSIAVGNPAKIIKQEIEWERDRSHWQLNLNNNIITKQ